jgi:hypothetical protein
MANIPIVDARNLFTKEIVDVYRLIPEPTQFLRTFFPERIAATKEVAIEVERGLEKIAVDVERNTEGNRNKIVTTTEKNFVPPYYREYFDLTDISLYDALFGAAATSISSAIYDQFTNNVAEKIAMLQYKIERAYENQCAQVLQTGKVLINAGGANANIDFKRKATSIVDLTSAKYWDKLSGSDSVTDPADTLKAACEFIRTVGKGMGGTFNAILGSSALMALQNNTFVKDRGKIFNYALDMLNTPQRTAEGATLHGWISAGAWKIYLWSYPQFYDDANNSSVPYIDPTKVIVVPESPRFRMAYAAVPQLIGEGVAPMIGKYHVGEYKDQRLSHHIMDIKSAGVAIPVAVDQIYTVKVVAS